ncbi:MAG: Imidazole glycerol phosphate synthase subunit HisH [Candidatus Roizmanbacteria bacterium GW2011_GWA2_37_7]|uniref:Imidazole glycerol phosphate synthase subunit HisH n=1 Tax=Candidatus Roizmanbacteria bacterium GW2011_GWA2_37_7 TaxID=1618481 RepID=A0A0G0K685_9BACT|nr:MAG: Imidazole glycerol phosphate synthase subunit HisH [Candidatus Roizmanbacteria bacterium GW2011_GWA2_37_7]
MIAIIDYGAGNLKSVTNALDFLRVSYKVTDKAEDIKKSDKIIFPGVGSFGDCINSLKKKGIFETLKKEISNKPYLGICLGLQVLFEESEESSGIKGLSIFKGKCKKFKNKNLKVPQIGWNSIKIIKKNNLLKDVKDDSYFYFVHSYYVGPKDKGIIATKTNYGIEYCSGITKDNIFAFQFHPERSGEIGLKILKNFVEL